MILGCCAKNLAELSFLRRVLVLGGTKAKRPPDKAVPPLVWRSRPPKTKTRQGGALLWSLPKHVLKNLALLSFSVPPLRFKKLSSAKFFKRAPRS
jgi:hypothetical protein